MPKAKRIFIVGDTKDFTGKLLLIDLRRRVKGLIRLGHDVQVFSYNTAFWCLAPVKSKLLKRKWCKPLVDELLEKQLRNYSPDIVFVTFANFLDANTIKLIRSAAPDATVVGIDGDIWPELHELRIEASCEMDLVLTTYAGNGIEAYKKAGVRTVFLPNMCDPDIEHRYDVTDEWKCDILFTGKTRAEKSKYPSERGRYTLLKRLSESKNSTIYGCFGRPKIEGVNYFYAISGAKIGVSINARNDIDLYHSDRLTNYLASGTLVLAKRVPDSDMLFKDGVHLKYFDTAEEFFELSDWYLKHEEERLKIANAGMKYVHEEFNCEKIAKYSMDIIEKGTYDAPWCGCL